MYSIMRRMALILLLLIPNFSFAQQELRIGVGNFPPFFVEQGQKGVFLEVIDAIFSQLPAYQVKYIFMSNDRLTYEINSGKLIDVACNIFPNADVNAYLSEPLFRYTDVAISRKSAGLSVNSITDLQHYSIAAYQGAKYLLGEEFKQMAEHNANYSEHSQPKDTSFLMVSGVKDIRIGDINIFYHDLNNKHIRSKVSGDNDDFTIHRLWPAVYSNMAFKDQLLRDSVNEVIKQLKQNGTIERIYQKHRIQ